MCNFSHFAPPFLCSRRVSRSSPFFSFSFTVALQIGDTFRDSTPRGEKTVRAKQMSTTRRTFSFASLDSSHGLAKEKSLSVVWLVARFLVLLILLPSEEANWKTKERSGEAPATRIETRKPRGSSAAYQVAASFAQIAFGPGNPGASHMNVGDTHTRASSRPL